MNTLILMGAVILLALGLWQCSPANQEELCTKLGALQDTKSEKTEDQLNALARAAKNYRGNQSSAVRAEGGKLSGIKGPLIQPGTLDRATVAIRNVCGAPSFGK